VERISTVIGAIVGVLTIIGAVYGFYRWSFKRGYERAKTDGLEKRYKQQYEKIYAPLRTAFLEIQVTSSTFTAFPYLRQRIKRAFKLAKERKLKKSIAAIWDKGTSEPSTEIEFGPGFPLSYIRDVLTKNATIANSEIMDLYQSADRARYESQLIGRRGNDHELLSEEYELFLHIIEKYEELSKRFE